MASYRSAQKLRRDNALSEITSDATLKATALANLGLTDVAGNNVAVATGKTFGVSNSLVLAGTDGTTMTFPSTSATVARTDAANTFTGVQTMTSPVLVTPALGVATATAITYAAGTTSVAPEVFTSGTNLTTPVAGAVEYDGAVRYFTNDTTSGRGYVPSRQSFSLTSTGSTISTIANYFGTTSNISLVASGNYEIDIWAWFLKSTAGTVVWTLTNSAAPTSQNIIYEMSPVAGIVAPPGTATLLCGNVYNDNTAALALTATGSLTDAVNHYMHMKIQLRNGTGTSLKIQATASAGTITPGIGSRWICTRHPAANNGTFAA